MAHGLESRVPLLDHPLVELLAGASADVGEPTRLGGLDSWYDAATFTRFGGTPCIGYGPRDIAWMFLPIWIGV